DTKFQHILDDFYDFRSREFPEFATFVGHHNYDDALESFTLEAFERRKNETEKFLGRVKNLDTQQMSKFNQRERGVLISFLQTFVEGYRWHDYGTLSSINFLEGLAKGPQWTLYSRLETEQDFDNYLKRLAAFPQQVSEQIELMKRAIKLGSSSHIVSVDYMENTRKQAGVHSLPQGLQYYQACLKWYVGFDITAEEVFELGVKEVARIEKKIKEVMSSVGFLGDLKSFFKHIETIPQFYNHTKNQILEKYRTILEVDILPRLDILFYNLTISPITVVPVDRDGPWGSYGLSMFYVNLKEPMKRSTFTMMPLTLHEAYPGHHFQDFYSQHFDIPLYRAQPMNGRLYSVPFHFPVYSAYAEGWALYSEYLGHELGLYQDPYELFGRYVSEIFRACRLVVDTGIHAFGWSRERAIEFLSGYSDFPLSQIAAEVDRYITAPGQACSYKVGEMKIKNIRAKAEKALGPLFDVKEFHHQILKTGFVPLDVLEEVVDEWVQQKLLSDSPVTADYFSDLDTPHSGQILPLVAIVLLLCCLQVSYLTHILR
ncbi:unnamed protein product, partial [Candidula unifasciata]